MSRYGLEVFRPDGTSLVMDNKTTVTKIAGTGSKGLSFGEWNTGIAVPAGYDYFLWMSSYAWIDYIVSGSQWVPSGFAYLQPYLDAHRILRVTPHSLQSAIPASYYGAYIWPSAGTLKGYGIQFRGVNNFTGISHISQFSGLLYKGEIDIYDGWLPSHVHPAFTADQVMCYFYTEETSKTICMSPSPDDRRYRVFYVNGGGGATLSAKVCIFGQGTLQRSRYGLEIYSKQNGSVVYNSGYDILTRPNLVPLTGAALGSMHAVEGVVRPMYAPCNIGAMYHYPWQIYVWVNSNGRQIGPAWGWAKHQRASRGPVTYYVSSIPVMVLDATDYFHF
ncbi:hypothetical protein [Yersinia mollaretii]|uniref:hypothetical protein n=1 Tax=Yersinia mollaretii TaxID=33060 RepID=UPI0011A84192|nr:hypothetical protein [Yersinia mollaretii]